MDNLGRVNPNASWQDVITALETVQENALAEKIKKNLGTQPTLSSSQGATNIDIQKLCRALREVLIRNYARLSRFLKDTLPYVAAEMYSKGLISHAVKDNPTYDNMIREFEAGLQFLGSVSKLEKHCQLFLKCLSSQGGPMVIVAKHLEEEWNKQFIEFGKKPTWSVENYKRLYEKAKRDGYVVVKWSKFSLSGPPGTGKSSFLKLLFNEPSPEHHDSTPVVRAHKARITTAITNEVSLWKEIEPKDLRVMIAEAIKQEIRHRKSDDKDSSIDDSEATTIVEEESEAIDQEILDLLPFASESLKLYESHWIYAIDTGGQAAFLDIAPALLHCHSVNILTHKLTDRLKDKAKFYFSSNGKMIGKPEERQITNLQLLISSIHSLSSQNRGMKHAHIILGTFIDQMVESGESLPEKNKCLWSNLVKKFRDELIIHCQSTNQIIYPVNTIARDDHEMKTAIEIRKAICQYTNDDEVPIRWFLFQLKLQDELERQNKLQISQVSTMNTLSISECFTIGETLQMDHDNIRAALNHFHNLSIFLYFNILPEVVFLHPQGLFDKLSELISVSYDNAIDYFKEDGIHIPLGYQEELKNEGTFNEDLLTQFLKDGFPSTFSAEQFLYLMTELSIFASLPEQGKYFLPSVLPTTDTPLPFFDESVDPLIFTWNEEPLPRGVFPALIVNLLHRKVSPKFHLSKQQQQRYRNDIILCGDECCIKLADMIDYIKIQYKGSLEECVNVQKAVCEGLNSVTCKFRYSNIMKACLRCRICTDKSPEHLCHLNEGKTKLVCDRSYQNKLIINLPHQQRPWFQDEGPTNATAATGTQPIDENDFGVPSKKICSCKHDISEILKSKPDEHDLHKLLADISSQWYELGLVLRLQLNFLNGLRNNQQGIDFIKLTEVIHKWMTTTEQNLVTWETVVAVFEESIIKNLLIATKIREFLASKAQR